MKVLVSDTSVLIDAERGSLLEICFGLPFVFVVPDLLYRQELQEYGGPALIQLGLRVEELDGGGVSLALARLNSWNLLSGDRKLRELTRLLPEQREVLLSRLETPTPANVLAFPGKHRHGRDARPYLALDAELFRVHLTTVENPVKKAPLVLRQLEEEGEPFPAQFHGLRDPRVDIARIAEQVRGQADGEIAAKLA